MDGGNIICLEKTDRAKSCVLFPNGIFFDPLRPDPRLIDMETIAISLGNQCRFAGLVEDFYSTAQHSVLVAALAPDDLGAQKMALLHDADEFGGLTDMVSPVKPEFPDYVKAQNRIGRAVEIRFDLDHADHPRIKPADRRALAIEKRCLKPAGEAGYWDSYADLHPGDMNITVDPLMPKVARRLFLDAVDLVFEQGLPVTLDWLLERDGFRMDTCAPSP